MANLIITKDRKEALTLEEFKVVLESLKNFTEVESWGTDFKVEENKRKYFFWVKFNKFEKYPQFIGLLHESYGRKLDVRTLYAESKEDLLEVYIRGYAKELK